MGLRNNILYKLWTVIFGGILFSQIEQLVYDKLRKQ